MNWIRVYDVCFLWFVCTMKLLSIKQFCWPSKLSSNRLISSAPRQSALLETFSRKTQFKPSKYTYIIENVHLLTFQEVLQIPPSINYLPFFVIFALKDYMNIRQLWTIFARNCICQRTFCDDMHFPVFSLYLSLLLIQRYLSYLCALLDCLDLHVMRESQTSQFQLKLANENNINNNTK